MAVRYYPYSGCRVSGRWLTVLRAADRAHVGFSLNSGHRTFAEQQELYDAYIRYLNGGPWAPLAAKPSHNAPHIRTGRAAHAVDVSSTDGGETRLQRFLESHGATVTNPVRGESWHMEISGRDLAKLARKLKPRPLTQAMKDRRRARKIARKYGISSYMAYLIIQECRRAGLLPRYGFALIEKESGFKNVWGGDPAPNGGTTGWRFRKVTKRDYQAYKRRRGPNGGGGMQGCGPAQLTWYTLQDAADQAGGCWKARVNIRAAFNHLRPLIRAYGVYGGARRYNGSGAAAEAYARDFVVRAHKWGRRFASTRSK